MLVTISAAHAPEAELQPWRLSTAATSTACCRVALPLLLLLLLLLLVFL
jgi:hypothetical protein